MLTILGVLIGITVLLALLITCNRFALKELEYRKLEIINI